MPRARRAELNRLLVAEGLEIEELRTRRPSLEDFFHQTITAETEPQDNAA